MTRLLTENCISNLVKANQIWTVITYSRLSYHQTLCAQREYIGIFNMHEVYGGKL